MPARHISIDPRHVAFSFRAVFRDAGRFSVLDFESIHSTPPVAASRPEASPVLSLLPHVPGGPERMQNAMYAMHPRTEFTNCTPSAPSDRNVIPWT
jgi:hypothetical protein